MTNVVDLAGNPIQAPNEDGDISLYPVIGQMISDDDKIEQIFIACVVGGELRLLSSSGNKASDYFLLAQAMKHVLDADQ